MRTEAPLGLGQEDFGEVLQELRQAYTLYERDPRQMNAPELEMHTAAREHAPQSMINLLRLLPGVQLDESSIKTLRSSYSLGDGNTPALALLSQGKGENGVNVGVQLASPGARARTLTEEAKTILRITRKYEGSYFTVILNIKNDGSLESGTLITSEFVISGGKVRIPLGRRLLFDGSGRLEHTAGATSFDSDIRLNLSHILETVTSSEHIDEPFNTQEMIFGGDHTSEKPKHGIADSVILYYRPTELQIQLYEALTHPDATIPTEEAEEIAFSRNPSVLSAALEQNRLKLSLIEEQVNSSDNVNQNEIQLRRAAHLKKQISIIEHILASYN